jgi:hypothetical protein
MSDLQTETQFPAPASVRGASAARTPTKLGNVLDRSFYFLMSLLIAVIVAYGFGREINVSLIHPPSPRPAILWVHAVLFTGWLFFLILQSALVRTRNVKVHKRLGWFGLALGVAMPFVGFATAIAMGRLRMRESDTVAAFLIIPFNDLAAFTLAFGLAFYWRKWPEFHRRLILMATCALTAAAFARFPLSIMPTQWFYAGVDVLILFAVARDLIVTRRVHPVYLYGLPMVMLGQTAAMYIYLSGWPPWWRVAHALLG